jgi:hypothetical protein
MAYSTVAVDGAINEITPWTCPLMNCRLLHMQVLSRFRKELEAIKSPAFLSFFEGLEALDLESGKPAPAVPNPNQTIGIGKDLAIGQIVDLFAHQKLQHFVQVGRANFLYDLFASAVMLKRPDNFIRNPLPYFIQNFKEKLLREATLQHIVLPIQKIQEKTETMLQVDLFLRGSPKTSLFRKEALVIVDEFITNALFAGPNGETVESSQTPANIFLAHDDSRLLIGFKDSLGLIDRDTILKSLAFTYKSNSMDATQGPLLGLSYRLIVDNSSSLYVVVERMRSALVCVCLPISGGYKHFANTPKNLHFCFF